MKTVGLWYVVCVEARFGGMLVSTGAKILSVYFAVVYFTNPQVLGCSSNGFGWHEQKFNQWEWPHDLILLCTVIMQSKNSSVQWNVTCLDLCTQLY